MNRRGFILGALAAPLVVHASTLMPIKRLDVPMPRTPGMWGRRNGVWIDVRLDSSYNDGGIRAPWHLGIDQFAVVTAFSTCPNKPRVVDTWRSSLRAHGVKAPVFTEWRPNV